MSRSPSPGLTLKSGHTKARCARAAEVRLAATDFDAKTADMAVPAAERPAATAATV